MLGTNFFRKKLKLCQYLMLMKKTYKTAALSLKLLLFVLLVTSYGSALNVTGFTSYESGYITGKISVPRLFSLPRKLVAANNLKQTDFQNENIFESEEIRTEFTFSGLIVSWKELIPQDTSASLEIKFLENQQWGQWQLIETDNDVASPITDQNGYITGDSLLFSNGAEAFMYRVITSTANPALSPQIIDLSFEYLDNKILKITNYPSPVIKEELVAGLTLPKSEKEIILRDQWGANEAFNYKSYYKNEEKPAISAETDDPNNTSEANITNAPKKPQIVSEAIIISKVETDPVNGEELLWPLEYPDRIKKIFIHHTATTKDLQNPIVALRNIYHYHAVSKGWGDIGYNYIIDDYGNIYEGRRGGDGVVGGHTGGYNRGSIGIALLGDYEHEQPGFEMMAALIKLTKQLTDKYGIDPEGALSFNGVIIPNISAHHEVSATRCPGGNMSSMLSAVRKITARVGKGLSLNVETGNRAPLPDYAFQLVGEYQPVYLEADSEAVINFQFKNTGGKSWNSETFLIANQEGNNRGSIEFLEKYTISKQHEAIIQPGEIGTYTIKLKSGLRPDLLAFDLTLIFDGEIKTDNYFSLPVYVNAPRMEFLEQSGPIFPGELKPGSAVDIEYRVLNSGTQDWTGTGTSAVKLIFDEPLWHQSPLLAEGALVAALPEEETVKPGEIATFKFRATLPTKAGAIFEKMTLYNDFYGKLDGELSPISFYLGSSEKPAAQLVSIKPQKAFARGEIRVIEFKIRNTGSRIWKRIGDDAVKVASVHNPAIQTPEQFSFNEGEVKPGELATFTLPITAPEKIGEHVVLFVPWFKNTRLLEKPIYFYFNVYGYGEEEGDRGSEFSMKETPLRVKIGFAKPMAQVSASSDYQILDGENVVFNLAAGEITEISLSSGKITVKNAGTQLVFSGPIRVLLLTEGIIEVINFENHPAWNPNLNDNRFRGTLEIRDYNNQLTLINELPLEDYLKGIGEVSNSDPLEKIKTIIVLARTYAKYYRDLDKKFADAPYHLDDNPDVSQKYLGYGLEERAPNIVAAVAATSGQVVTYQGRLIKTPYFNTSDGRTRSAKEVWGWTTTPYLQSVSDPLCQAGVLNGHGVGLSGCGATEAAKMGKNYAEIIKYYYQGVEIALP